MMSSGINLVMTVIGFIVSTMFIVFVCTRLVCARLRLNSSRRSFPIASRSDLSILELGLHGLEPLVIANFPTKKYSDEFFSAAGDVQCSVCLGEYHSEDVLRILPYCGHFFHITCIDVWLQQHSTCPVCRISLQEFPNRKRRLQQHLYGSLMQSENGTETFDARSCDYMSFSPRTHDHNHGTDPIREDHLASLGNTAEARQEINGVVDRETPHVKELVKEHVESPSDRP